MDPRRIGLSLICFTFVLCLLASSAVSQELTTRSSFAASFTFNTDTTFQTGAFRDSYLKEDTLIFTTRSGVVVFDLASKNWLDPTSSITEGARTMFYGSTFIPIAPYYDSTRNRIIVASDSSNPQISLLDFSTLKLIQTLQNNETVGNPRQAPFLSGVYGVVSDDTYLYYGSAR